MTDLAEQQDLSALSILAPYSEQIRGCADDQTIQFVPATWRRWLEQARWSPDQTDELLGRFGETVDRAQIRDLAMSINDDWARQRLLVATLIWGRGKSNGRMRDHIVGLLRCPDLDQGLAASATLAAAGQPAAAYRTWQLPGLREPFFTKWLWAASTAGPPENRCLVLDQRVWASLNNALGWTSWIAAGSRSRADRYAAYVQRCHAWAAELGDRVSPEDIECALFRANGTLTKLREPT